MEAEITMLDFWKKHDTKELHEDYFIHWWDTQEIPQIHILTEIKRDFKESEDGIKMISTLAFADGSVVSLKDDEMIFYGESYGVKF